MNKKGQLSSPFFLFMVGVILFIITFALVSPLVKSSNLVRTTLDCGNTSISTAEKVTCTTVDVVSPFILAIIIGIAGMLITAKLMGG